MYVPMVWVFAGALIIVILGVVAAELWRLARDADEALGRTAFTARFQRQRAEQAEARAEELECRLRYVLDLHAEAAERHN